ncbi:MAG TPA: ATP-binding cassette domain-containing protein [Caldithrix abyssi]|uniref:ATP-binding cassette domain-containing protein n=1 Tax=Caldithrix abyssi TaxID=187145 RepID=A0A7V5H3P1_CALAY|nr:ATP-binding cassette domain-containing protein [Caldithrix abyssi]
MEVLKVENVSKSFDEVHAVKDVSFTIETGKIYGLLGPNGAGKTTTIRMIMNIIMPDSGKVTLFGQSMCDELKPKIGYLPEERGVYPKMKVRDFLKFLGELHDMASAELDEKIDYWLNRFEIATMNYFKVEELSKGNQQKVQLIGSFLHDPQLIILDEPFSGLDPVNVNLVKEIILDFKKQDKALILSTHMMEAAEKICDHVYLINKGQKVLDGPIDEIQTQYGHNSMQLEYKGDGQVIKGLPIVTNFNDFGNFVEIQLKEGTTVNDLLKELINKIEIYRLQAKRSTLNEIFISLVKGGEKDA